MQPEISFRPICVQDEEFLYRLYASTREEELAITDWSVAQKESFLRMQFAAQHRHYQEHYAGTSFDLILADGEPIGRLYVARWSREFRLVDIALIPAWRNRGIGRALIEDLLAEAEQCGLPVSVHVECFNPAQHLYYSLGFEKIADKGVYYLLERKPGERLMKRNTECLTN